MKTLPFLLALAACAPSPEMLEAELEEVTNAPATTASPWSVFLRFDDAVCTGTLISPHWIVTAAHCLKGRSIHTDPLKVDITLVSGTRETAYNGAASYYNHPDYDSWTADRGDDLGLIRLYGDGLPGVTAAWIYDDPREPWYDDVGTQLADAWVAGYGRGSGPGGTTSGEGSGLTTGTKRLGRVALSGDVDEDGIFGTGPAIGVEGHRDYQQDVCPGDSGAAWSFLRGTRFLVFAVHNGNNSSTDWSGDEWATLIGPKLGWIMSTSVAKGLPITCSRARYNGTWIRRCVD